MPARPTKTSPSIATIDGDHSKSGAVSSANRSRSFALNASIRRSTSSTSSCDIALLPGAGDAHRSPDRCPFHAGTLAAFEPRSGTGSQRWARLSGRRLDVLVDAEGVARVVAGLGFGEALVVAPVGRSDTGIALVHHEVHVRPARRIGV